VVSDAADLRFRDRIRLCTPARCRGRASASGAPGATGCEAGLAAGRRAAAAVPQTVGAAQPAAAAPPASKADGDDVVARVGNINLSAGELRGYIAALDARERAAIAQDPALLSQAVRMQLANRLVLQELEAKKWDQQPTVAAQLDKLRENVLVELYLQTVSTPPASYPSDDEVQQVYDANRAALLMPRQFQLAQIFVALPKDADKTVDDKAKKAVDDIRHKLKTPGADFAAIAIENDSKTSGDLGWLPDRFDPKSAPRSCSSARGRSRSRSGSMTAGTFSS
jgi:peptidylprolyl isomerase